VVLDELDGKTLEIAPSGERDDRAHDDQIILYRVVFGAGPKGAG
jgi:hypothetical protein